MWPRGRSTAALWPSEQANHPPPACNAHPDAAPLRRCCRHHLCCSGKLTPGWLHRDTGEPEGEGREIQPGGLKILEELLSHNACMRIDRQLHLTDFFVNFLHEVDHKVHQLCLYICSVWKLVIRKLISYPATGFLRRIKKFSARIIMKRMNLWHRIFSISSACFIAMLTELMEPSIRTFSFSFLLMVTGCSRSSLLLLTSTSGLLCSSMTWEEKFSKQWAACSVVCTALR